MAKDTNGTAAGAYLVPLHYSSGRPYVIVRCDDHPAPWVINSGHHYDASEPYAQAAIARHNAEHHEHGTVCSLDSGSLTGNEPLCDRAAEVAVTYKGYAWQTRQELTTTRVCKRHLDAKRGQIYPDEIVSVDPIGGAS